MDLCVHVHVCILKVWYRFPLSLVDWDSQSWDCLPPVPLTLQLMLASCHSMVSKGIGVGIGIPQPASTLIFDLFQCWRILCAGLACLPQWQVYFLTKLEACPLVFCDLGLWLLPNLIEDKFFCFFFCYYYYFNLLPRDENKDVLNNLKLEVWNYFTCLKSHKFKKIRLTCLYFLINYHS